MPKALALGLAIAIGALGAVQARINGQLASRLGDGMTAAFISFASGLAIVAVIVALKPPARLAVLRLPHQVRHGRLRWWQLVGGAGGALLVTGQAIAVPTLGVALFTVAVVAGQTSAGLVVDRVGLGPAGVTPVTVRRLLAAGVAVLAVFVAVSNRLSTADFAVGAAVLTLVAGGLTSAQQAVNGRVGAATGQPFAATVVNFLAGTATLGVLLGVRLASTGLPPLHPPREWWLYLGGSVGVVYIAIASVLVVPLGVLLLGLASVSGQLLGAVLLDVVAPAHGASIDVATVLGVLITFGAVVLARSPRAPLAAD